MKSFVTAASIALMALFASAAMGTSAQAAPVVLDHTDRGWYRDNGHSNTSNDNYVAGADVSNNGPLRNFFVFDLSSVSGSITSAELRLENPVEGFDGTYEVWSFEGSIAGLSSGANSVPMYTDLGDGTLFASTALTSSIGTKIITLNTLALSAIQGAGGLLAFGGTFTGTHIFSGTHFGSPLTQLALTVETVGAPTPAAALLLGVGLIGLAARRHRLI